MNYLLQLSLGPVQGFIATARRSRDLWFGSYILSEISKAAALSLHRAGGAQLVFPHTADPENPADKSYLAKQLQPDSDFLVTNNVVCELTGSVGLDAARTVLGQAVDAARLRWETLCGVALMQIDEAAKRRKQTKNDFYDERVWSAQLGDVVEVFQGIVAYEPGQTGAYRAANHQLRSLLANRKNTRNFSSFQDGFRLPKSSLDGAQSTVIREAAATQSKGKIARLRKRLGVEMNEQLDTPAVVKRVIGRGRGFLPTARVAAQEWITRVGAGSELLSPDGEDGKSNVQGTQPVANPLDQVANLLGDLAKSDVGTELTGKYREYPWVQPLAFDGQLLFRHRIEAERAALDNLQNLPDPDFREDDLARERTTESALSRLDAALVELYKTHGPPQPYYGLLLADGDKMGRLIDQATETSTNGNKHRAISLALSRFAQGVPRLMHDREGACIYSGGDDVLGLVPVHRAIEIANALRMEFANTLRQLAQDNGLLADDFPTLSVGIALVHFLEPMGDARALAGKAEQLAKGTHLSGPLQRNALCVIAKPRSGSPMAIRIRWSEPEDLIRLGRWSRWLSASQRKLPRGLPDELHELYVHCAKVYDPSQNAEPFVHLWRARLVAILKMKRAGSDALDEDCVQDLLDALCPAPSADPSGPLQQLLLARWLSGQTETLDT